MVAGGTEKQAGLGLAAVAIRAIVRDDRPRMVEAVVGGVNARAGAGKLSAHFVVDCVKQPRSELPFGDSRLIRDDNDGKAEAIELGDGLSGAVKELEFGGPCGRVYGAGFGVVGVAIDDAVAVEK